MLPDKVLPLATAAIGVVSAIVATVQAIRAARITASANVEIERMKADAERRKHALSIASQEVEPVAEVLAQAWSDLQALKDFLSMASRGSLDALVRGAAAEAAQNFYSGYKQWGSKLPAPAAQAWHDGRYVAMKITRLLEEQPRRRKDPEYTGAALEVMRRQLTEFQTAIGAARATLREDQMRRVLEILS